MTFIAKWPLSNVQPADYNPRRIKPEAFATLCLSIRRLGFLKPIIVARDGLLVAGHQRTAAAKSEGMLTVPAWHLDRLSKHDEVRFNQLHNGTDIDALSETVEVSVARPVGRFAIVNPDRIVGDMKSRGAALRHEIGVMLARYGNWGAAVAGENGRIVSGQQYALACKLVGMPVRIRTIPDSLLDLAEATFRETFGEYSYERVERHSYQQSLAQPHRNIDDPENVHLPSKLYEHHVIPSLKREERMLDFGCGTGTYVDALKSKGYRAIGVEFFRRREFSIDKTAVHGMVDVLERELRENGLFDVLVCDSVLNSTNSPVTEADVMNVVAAFVKPGGRVYVSARTNLDIATRLRARTYGGKSAQNRRVVEFLDENNLSGTLRDGRWFFQRFYPREQFESLVERHLGARPCEVKIRRLAYQSLTYLAARRPGPELEESILREFNLPWPNGESIGRGERVLDAWRVAATISKK